MPPWLSVVCFSLLFTGFVEPVENVLTARTWPIYVFTVIFPGLSAEISADTNPSVRFSRQKWCPWSKWSRCAPVSCQSEIRPYPNFSLESQASETDDESDLSSQDPLLLSYCVIEPTTKSRKVIWTAVVQYTNGGVTRTRTPLKRRTRLCTCPSFSIFNVMKLFTQDECSRSSEEVQCAMCSSDEPIYAAQHPFEGDRPLAFCDPFSQGAFHLYKILGGVAAGVVIVLFIIWLIRVICRTVSRSPRVAAGRSLSSDNGPDGRRCRVGGRGSRTRSGIGADGVRVTGLVDHTRTGWPLLSNGPPGTDSPPAYKDVVGIMPQVNIVSPPGEPGNGDDGLHRFFRAFYKPSFPHQHQSPHQFSQTSLADDADENASSSQNMDGHARSSETPPPPSYEDIVTGGQLMGVHVSATNANPVPTGHGNGVGVDRHLQTIPNPSDSPNYNVGSDDDDGGNRVTDTAVRLHIPTAPSDES